MLDRQSVEAAAEAAVMDDDGSCAGFCRSCGAEHDSPVEPDAKGYRCGVCGAMRVDSCLLILGLI